MTMQKKQKSAIKKTMTPAKKLTPFTFTMAVAYADTDAGGVAYHGRYLDMAERARLDMLTQLNYPSSKMVRDDQGCFVVKHATLDYRYPARLEDMVTITTTPLSMGRTSITFRQEFTCNEKTLAVLEILLVFVSTASWRPTRLPPALNKLLSDILRN
ncbi:MAG: thioesterase family protein [Hydrotalea sp.]|nr:thioesterase family protein [Hydrotalea sp.]